MYERNAIVLERYFNKAFGYDMKNNIKTNFKDYCELIECLEKYKDISEEEENVMQEYDMIANKIRDIQRTQELLNKKNLRLQEERNNIFQNIDEKEESIQKKLKAVNENINTINEEITENSQKFVEIVTEFNEKSEIRTSCGRTRRTVEDDYNKKLNQTLDNYRDIDINMEKRAKQFIQQDTENLEKELKNRIKLNGKNEKIAFNNEVINKAITLCVDIHKRETDILAGIYEKTNRLFIEIKNNTVKMDKHKKAIKDAKSKLEFISALKEYLIQFLDNERLTAVNGEVEHNSLMKVACKNLDEDLGQINNLYTLLLKEITKKISKKSYVDLYNFRYLKELENKANEFDTEIKKLNLPVTIINPNYWRIEGMKKIYDVFYESITETYGRDLSEYMPKEEKTEQIFEEEEIEEDIIDIEEEKETETETEDNTYTERNSNKKEDTRTEIDKKIDLILGFNEGKLKEKTWAEEGFKDEDEWDDSEDTYWEDEFDDGENDEDDEDEWDEDEWDDSYDDKDEKDIKEEIWDEDEEDTESFNELKSEKVDKPIVDWDDDDWNWNESNNDVNEKIDEDKITKRKNREEAEWENQFVQFDKKLSAKRKKSFFDKFKK